MNSKDNFLSRRKWLTILGMGSLGGFFSGIVNPGKMNNYINKSTPERYIHKQPEKKKSPVSLVKGDDRYSIVYNSLKNIEDEVIGAIGDKMILIKPNMVVANVPACATDPIAVKAILDFLKPHYKKQIIIGESTAAYQNVTTLDLFKQYGYSSLANDYNVSFIDLNTAGYEYRHIWGAENRPVFIRVNKPFLDPNVFIISAAKMKTHSQCIVTLSLKNVLMAAPVNDYQKNDWKIGDKYNMHVIPEAAADGPIFYNLFLMAHYVYPDLAVIDGYEGMEGNGPASGTPIASRMAIASLDALAADTVGATVMGFDPEIIPYFKFLNLAGFGQGNINEIEVVGTPLSQCKMKFKPSDASAKVFNLS
jgi:uncharacterized protein (DUF362 family)